MNLQTDITSLDRAFKLQAKKLAKLGIYTVKDILYHIPSRYEDSRIISPINKLQIGESVTVRGNIVDLKNEYRSRHFTMQKVIISDGKSEIECRFFNQPYLIKSLSKGAYFSVSGTVAYYGKKKCIDVKDYEVLSDPQATGIHTGRLAPVYPLTFGLSSKWLRNKTFDIIFNKAPIIPEFLPENLLLSNNLPEISTAIKTIHFPHDFQEVAQALNRLSYDELFLVQLGALQRRFLWEKKEKAPSLSILKHKKKLDEFIKSLPFTLTNSQLKALQDLYADMSKNVPMNRLLEGDVGSGKTVVAAAAAYATVLNGFQAVIMAPTEILANQHYTAVRNMLEPFGIKISLVTGTTSKKLTTSPSILSPNIFIGTHALLHKSVEMENLGLVVIDEQQRFGVEQRGILRTKSNSPHFLTMTATPIPRTVFLTLYGDLSLSVLDEMPKGRVRVKTWLVPNEKREKGYEWIKTKILETDENGKRNQAFIICPFIEESESATTIKAATKEFEHLSKDIFKNFKVGLLHGKMKGKEKDEVLSKFERGKLDVLVATPVVEVGIDIPNATIMVIEAAERFGLAQLHQLRGRVGRRTRESFCLLYTESTSNKTIERLKSLETIYVGAELAELDLKLRGPGDMYGTAQHGAKMLKIASLSNFELIIKTKKDAESIFKDIKKHPELLKKAIAETTQKILPD